MPITDLTRVIVPPIKLCRIIGYFPLAAALLLAQPTYAPGQSQPPGRPAAGDGQGTEPAITMLRHHIRSEDLPEIYHSSSVNNPPFVVPQPSDALLKVPPGFTVEEVAAELEGPRQMVLAPNGDLFVSEPRGDRVSILRDTNSDGTFDRRWTFSDDLHQPFGIAFVDQWVYFGNTSSLVRYRYKDGQTKASGKPEKLFDLPTGGHRTRDVIYNPGERKLYVSVGSAGNISEAAPLRARVLRCNLDGSELEVFASGLRNPVGLAWQPITGELWTAVNERDGLGDDLVPDYVTSVKEGGFYGWPYSYIGSHPMPGYADKEPELVKRAIVPDVLIESHAAALGITFYTADQFPAYLQGGAFVALHGSWNRKERTGYKVVFLPFDQEGQARGYYEDFLTGWTDAPTKKMVWGRPVGVMVERDGSLLVSDDGNNKLWRVTYVGNGDR